MKTYLIAFEQQGYIEATIQVKAKSYKEAKQKASQVLIEAMYSVYKVNRKTAQEESCCILDEDGDEIDLEEEDD